MAKTMALPVTLIGITLPRVGVCHCRCIWSSSLARRAEEAVVALVDRVPGREALVEDKEACMPPTRPGLQEGAPSAWVEEAA